MNTFLSYFTLALVLFSSISCKQQGDTKVVTKYVTRASESELTKVSEEIKVSKEDKSITPKMNKEAKLTGLLDDYCELSSPNPNPHELRKYLSSALGMARSIQFLTNTSEKEPSCEKIGETIFEYPFAYAKYRYSNDGDQDLVVTSLDENLRVKSIYVSRVDRDLVVKHHDVLTTDKVKLRTFVFSKNDGKKRGTILIRTPYVHSSPVNYFYYAGLFSKQYDLNVVVQANRGTFFSEGNFSWFHNVNINDARETIDWIAKQAFSNQKIVTYGLSYDGYNSLASAIRPSKYLVASIACSAPSSSRNDSFSAGKNFQEALLKYIWDRSKSSYVSNFYEKLTYARNKGLKLNEYDNSIFGEDLFEWGEMVDALKNRETKYWKERDLYPHFKDIKVPVFHIAGLKDDQDSRDTVDGFNRAFKVNNELNYLWLHGAGHSCGNFSSSVEYNKLLDSLNKDEVYKVSDDFSRVSQDSFNGGRITDKERIDIKNIMLIDISSSREDSYRVNEKIPMGSEAIKFEIEIEDEVILNGTSSISLKFKGQGFHSVYSVGFKIVREDGSSYYSNLDNAADSSRTSFRFHSPNEISEKKVVVNFYPILEKVTPGSKIFVEITGSPVGVFNFYKEEKAEYIKGGGEDYIEIDLNESSFNISTETIIEVDEEDQFTDDVVN